MKLKRRVFTVIIWARLRVCLLLPHTLPHNAGLLQIAGDGGNKAIRQEDGDSSTRMRDDDIIYQPFIGLGHYCIARAACLRWRRPIIMVGLILFDWYISVYIMSIICQDTLDFTILNMSRASLLAKVYIYIRLFGDAIWHSRHSDSFDDILNSAESAERAGTKCCFHFERAWYWLALI